MAFTSTNDFLTLRFIKDIKMQDEVIYNYEIKNAVSSMKIVEDKYALLKRSTIIRDISSQKSIRRSGLDDRENFVKAEFIEVLNDELLELKKSIIFNSPAVRQLL